MHRAILIQCLPAVIALAIALVAVVVIVKASGARLNLRRLRELHRCQDGGVQSLSFVLTLPLFVIFVLFIVQISQLMIGLVTVNYAAFAAARAASVWIPAEVGGVEANVMPVLTDDNELILTGDSAYSDSWRYKHWQVFSAAALSCAPMGPSRDLQIDVDRYFRAGDAAEISKRLYAAMVPDSQRNRRIPERIENKIAYSFAHTAVKIEFRDKNSLTGPTYNPDMVAICDREENLLYYRPKDPYEVGWEDPITVTVYHNFALLPGPGRFLAKYVTGQREDEVARRIKRYSTPSSEYVYTTVISASATLTNEGLKSVLPYEQQRY